MDDEKAFDDFLSIDTTLCIGAEQPTEENNIYQATYYRDLVTLFNAVSMEPEDTLVDFGCGTGACVVLWQLKALLPRHGYRGRC